MNKILFIIDIFLIVIFLLSFISTVIYFSKLKRKNSNVLIHNLFGLSLFLTIASLLTWYFDIPNIFINNWKLFLFF